MIDVYGANGTFTDKHELAVDLATAVITIEQPGYHDASEGHRGVGA
jgi:hypothetical protein